MKSGLRCSLIYSLLLFLLFACMEIERDNILDPKNPSSKRESVLLVEAFVNTTHPSPYNGYALEALQTLRDNYKERIIIVELHKDVTGYKDDLTLTENENIHNRYTIDYLEEPGRNKGLPDLFLNGAADRVQGAFDVANVVTRAQNIVLEQLILDGAYTIEVDAEQNGDTISGNYRIARLGNKSSGDIFLRIYVVYNSQSLWPQSGKNTVSAVEEKTLTTPDAGSYLEEDFTLNVPQQKADKIILVLLDSSRLHVLHVSESVI